MFKKKPSYLVEVENVSSQQGLFFVFYQLYEITQVIFPVAVKKPTTLWHGRL